jgi:mannose-6-phosphate isomerase-like protein (cupin superfamily)
MTCHFSPIVKKPWGYYRDLHRNPNAVYKEIVIFPGESISLQYHNQRSEFWYIMNGVGLMTIGDDDVYLSEGDNMFIGKTIPHRIKNIGEGRLVIRELQCGVCSEDDIVRLDDKYGRVDK